MTGKMRENEKKAGTKWKNNAEWLVIQAPAGGFGKPERRNHRSPAGARTRQNHQEITANRDNTGKIRTKKDKER